MTKYPLTCPHCQANLDDGDIYEVVLEKYHDHFKATEAAGHFGWSMADKKRFSRIVGQYNLETDRTESYSCPDCRKEIMRR
jgi:hypothetical protein